MQVTVPTKSTREFIRKSQDVNADLKRFLKQSGCTSKTKIRDAVRRAAVKD